MNCKLHSGSVSNEGKSYTSKFFYSPLLRFKVPLRCVNWSCVFKGRGVGGLEKSLKPFASFLQCSINL